MALSPKKSRCDVLVVGGGSAGVAAAVASARSGAETVLVERHGALGGMASVALVHSICGLYLLRDEPAFPGGAVLANEGFPAEFAGRLLASGGAWGPRRLGKVDVLLQHPTAFATLCDTIVRGEASLTVRLHTEVTAVHGDGGRVTAAMTRCRGNDEVIEPSVVVDASGDAEVAAGCWPLAAGRHDAAGTEIARVPGKMGDSRAGNDAAPQPPVASSQQPLQRPAFIFSLLGVDPAALDRDGRVRLAARIAQGVRGGEVPRSATGATMHATGRGDEAFVTIDLDPPDGILYDPLDPACLTALEVHGRSLADALTRFLRASVPGFKACHIASLPGRVGVRESRQVRAVTTLTAEHLQRGAKFDDAIGLATWPMELRETVKGPRLRYPQGNVPCEVPLGALRVAGVGNLYAAGRCIGCDHGAQASIRVMGTCFVTGQAAGLAAALLARRGGEADHAEVDAAAVIAERRRVMDPHAEPFLHHPSHPST